MISKVQLNKTRDRRGVLNYIEEKRKKGAFTVVDIGGGITTEGLRPDLIVDINFPEGGKQRILRGDVSDGLVWDQLRKIVDDEGKFDFCFTSHLLEDIRNPPLVCKRMSQIATEGYLAVPSRHTELRKRAGWRGYMHHRWILTVVDEVLMLVPKLCFLESMIEMDKFAGDPEEMEVYWTGDLPFKVLNDDYMGPDIPSVLKLYKEVFKSDVFSEG